MQLSLVHVNAFAFLQRGRLHQRPIRMQSDSESAAPRRIAVVGSTGRTGQRIVKQIVEQLNDSNADTRVQCICRDSSKDKADSLFGRMTNVNVVPMNMDLSDDIAVQKTARIVLEDCDTVVCALGALESEALNWKNPYNIDGLLTQIFIDAAKRAPRVKHFVMVSSLGTEGFGFPASVLNLFWGVLTWKRASEMALMDSGLKYTIIRPGGMERPTDEFELTHNMKLLPSKSSYNGSISRKQVARLCAAAIMNPEDSTDLVVEAVADPEYPKLSAEELFAQYPKDKTNSYWRERLTRDQYYVLREAGTERPWTSPLNEEKREGVFVCAGCGSELFSSSSKFESGSGWPSFFSPISANAVLEEEDTSMFMKRTEILCKNCNGHLGHVFTDGPKPTGLRYCMNGVAMRFKTSAEMGEGASAKASDEIKIDQ